MFDIEYKGGNTVVISTKKSVLVTDPRRSVVGLKDIVTKDAVELATEARFALERSDAKLVIEGPGEYEVGDFSIRGVAAQRHIDASNGELAATIYRVEVQDVRIAILGNIAESITEDQLEAIGVIDMLIIPVGGGGYTLDATAAVNLVRRFDPKAVIPVHYADAALTYEVPQDELSVFTSELGAPVEVMDKLKIKAINNLPQVLTVIELSRS